MSKRNSTAGKEYITNAPVPEKTDTYTTLEHALVISTTLDQLAINGFMVHKELYKCSMNAQVAQGIYYLKYGNDPDMGMMFTWSNSYDKSLRFRCAMGGFVHASGNGVISGDMSSWGRKHTGVADVEMISTIQEQVRRAERHFCRVVADKDAMKETTVSLTRRAEIVGKLFIEHGVLNTEQMSVIRDQIHNPKFDYKADPESLWVFFNDILYAMQRCHPKDWMSRHMAIHYFLTTEFGIDNAHLSNLVDKTTPGYQLTIDDALEEVSHVTK